MRYAGGVGNRERRFQRAMSAADERVVNARILIDRGRVVVREARAGIARLGEIRAYYERLYRRFVAGREVDWGAPGMS